jgi:hypothetical protein
MDLPNVTAILKDLLSRNRFVPHVQSALQDGLLQEDQLCELLLYYTSGGPRLIRYLLCATDLVLQKSASKEVVGSTAKIMNQ